MKSIKSLASILMICGLVFTAPVALTACDDGDSGLDEAGDEIEEGMEEVGDEIDDATS